MPIRRLPKESHEPLNVETHRLRAHLAKWLHLHKNLDDEHYALTTRIKDLGGKTHDVEVGEIEKVYVPEGSKRAFFYLKNGAIVVASLGAAATAIRGIRMFMRHRK